jgi:glycosyltransferase involved in cell wall biosynthesis
MESPRAELLCAQLVAKIAHRIIVHSPACRDAVVKSLSVSDIRKCAIVRHASYLGHYRDYMAKKEARCRLGLGENDRVYLFFGDIRPYKGVLDLVASFRRSGIPGTLLIVGKAPEGDGADELLWAIKGCSQIRYCPGFVPDDEVQVYFRASDIAVFPYRRIFTSGALMLAISFGVPCIAPRLGFMEDMLRDGGGILYDVEDPGALAQALRRSAAMQPEAMSTMVRRNVSLADRLRWERIAAKTATIYRGSCGGVE